MVCKTLLWKTVYVCLLCVCTVLGVYGLSHQNDLLLTQTDILGLQYLAILALDGVSPYNQQAIQQLTGAVSFPVNELFYPPSFIPIIVPLAYLDPVTLRVGTALLQVVCAMLLGLHIAAQVKERWVAALFSPVLFFSLFQTARFGQITCFVVVAMLVLWRRYGSGRSSWVDVCLLFVATLKPSVTLGLVSFLIFERRFALLAYVGALHLVGLVLAAHITGLEPNSLVSTWLTSLSHYRDYPQNSPTGHFVYGLSAALYQSVGGGIYTLDVLVVPIAYFVWRQREFFSQLQSIALLLAASFVCGAPHAYDFFLLLPALACVLSVPYGTAVYYVFGILMVLPQRAMSLAGLGSFEGIFRIIVPLLMLIWLLVVGSKHECIAKFSKKASG